MRTAVDMAAASVATPVIRRMRNGRSSRHQEIIRVDEISPKTASSLSAWVDESIFAKAACGRMAAKTKICHGNPPAARLPGEHPKPW
jgi:hypothetical protein